MSGRACPAQRVAGNFGVLTMAYSGLGMVNISGLTAETQSSTRVLVLFTVKPVLFTTIHPQRQLGQRGLSSWACFDRVAGASTRGFAPRAVDGALWRARCARSSVCPTSRTRACHCWQDARRPVQVGEGQHARALPVCSLQHRVMEDLRQSYTHDLTDVGPMRGAGDGATDRLSCML